MASAKIKTRKAKRQVVRRTTRARPAGRGWTLDQAMLAVLIVAMDANQHVSPEEAARAHHIIWSMRRFRDRSGPVVDHLIEIVRSRVEKDGTPAVLAQAARNIPAPLRPSAFAVAVDLMLADAKLDRAERQFVKHLARTLKIADSLADDILAVLLIKNKS